MMKGEVESLEDLGILELEFWGEKRRRQMMKRCRRERWIEPSCNLKVDLN